MQDFDMLLGTLFGVWFFALLLIAGSKRAGAHHLWSLYAALIATPVLGVRTLEAIAAVGLEAAYTTHFDAPLHWVATSFFALGLFSSLRTIVKPARKLIEVEVAPRPIRRR